MPIQLEMNVVILIPSPMYDFTELCLLRLMVCSDWNGQPDIQSSTNRTFFNYLGSKESALSTPSRSSDELEHGLFHLWSALPGVRQLN